MYLNICIFSWSKHEISLVDFLFFRPLTGEEILEIINNCVGSVYNPIQFSLLTKKHLVFLWAVSISFFSWMIWWLIWLVSRYFICIRWKNKIFWFDLSLQSPFFRTILIGKALVSTNIVCNLRMFFFFFHYQYFYDDVMFCMLRHTCSWFCNGCFLNFNSNCNLI